MRVTNNASCNWVNLVQVSSVLFSSSAVNAVLQCAQKLTGIASFIYTALSQKQKNVYCLLFFLLLLLFILCFAVCMLFFLMLPQLLVNKDLYKKRKRTLKLNRNRFSPKTVTVKSQSCRRIWQKRVYGGKDSWDMWVFGAADNELWIKNHDAVIGINKSTTLSAHLIT